MRRIACIRLNENDCKWQIEPCELSIGKSTLPIANSQFSIFNLQSPLWPEGTKNPSAAREREQGPSATSVSIIVYCGRFSPIVGVDPTDRTNILLDITGLAHLFGGETALADAIVRGLKQLGLRIDLAIADTLGAAWAHRKGGKRKA